MKQAHTSIRKILQGKRIAILGYGAEGRSTYRLVRSLLADSPISICDLDLQAGAGHQAFRDGEPTTWFTGPDYMEGLSKADIIFKSPGIPITQVKDTSLHERIVSQTSLFTERFRKQVIGISGTKGKSTTASLLFHILKSAGVNAVLAGNIGKPCFDVLDSMDKETYVVFEMSSHQLQDIGVSPHIAILLNIFEEHLDYHGNYQDYQQAKLNIVRWQKAGDVFIFNPATPVLSGLVKDLHVPSRMISIGIPFSGAGMIGCEGNDMLFAEDQVEKRLHSLCEHIPLQGEHNKQNAAAAIAAALILGIQADQILAALKSFQALSHRLEHLGQFAGVDYYNDSIATIPEATIAALRALPATRTLILGGKDRGVNYNTLMEFLAESEVLNICFTGDAGRRMMEIATSLPAFSRKRLFGPGSFDLCVREAVRLSSGSGLCLLSPAAPSYDAFRNFEERGDRFRQLVSGDILL